MPQQYLPPALMLEQLRNERYRQAAQGMQQGLNQALQTYMNIEQLKQAAAEKKAERDERARQFNESQRMRQAELESLQALREGRLGLQQQQQTLAEKKAADAQAAVADAQDLAQLNLTAFGVDPEQRAIAGVDTSTATEFMRKGLRDFGEQRQAVTPKPEYEPVSREQILGIARPEAVDRPMQAEERAAPITARQAFEALPAGDDERAKTKRLMDALAADETAGIRRDFPTQETQQATIAPGAARILDRLAATEKQATGQAQQLFSNLDALLEAQQRRPQDFATAELYRDAGGKRAFGEISGARRAQEFAREKELLGLDKLKAETSALKALESQRKAAARGGGRGRGRGAGKPLISADVLQKALGSELKTIDVEDKQLEPMAAAISDLRSYKKDITGAETPPSPEDLAKANSLEQELMAKKAALQERRNKAVVDFREALRRLGEGKIDVYDTMAARQAQAAQPTDVGVPEMLRRPEPGQEAARQAVDPAQAAADASKQQRIKEIEAQMAALAPQVTAGPGSEPAIKMNQLAAERDKLLGIFRSDPGVAEAYRREAREAVAQKVALSPQDAERLIASAPLATQRKLKAEAAKMQNAGMSREEIAAVLGLRRAEMNPLSRGRF